MKLRVLPPLMFTLALVWIFVLWNPSFAGANPFTQKNSGQIQERPAPEPGVAVPGKPGIIREIILLQQQVREKMILQIRKARATGDILPLVWILGMALAYGMIHSAGPGHGKALAVSYVLGFKPGMARAFLFGNFLAWTHGMSGVGLVLLVKFVLQASMSASLDSFTQITQVISYSLISLVGLALFFKQVIAWKTRDKKRETRNPLADPRPSLYTALAVGMIPCPGVVLSMLFCLSMDLTFLGILMGLAISAGMGLTISFVAMAAVFSKSALLKGADGSKKRLVCLESAVEALAGLMLTALGLFFLLGVLL